MKACHLIDITSLIKIYNSDLFACKWQEIKKSLKHMQQNSSPNPSSGESKDDLG